MTEWTYDDKLDELEEDEEEIDDGMDGWPHPSAVECIQDDVRRLCLTDPNLEWVIAGCVDEFLRGIEGGLAQYQ